MTEKPITFHSEDINFSLNTPEKTIAWIQETIQAEGGNLSSLTFIFCSDPYLHQLNLEHLQHDTYTDIITFPYSNTELDSDIFISIDRVRENAETFETTFERELHQVMIHGVLHLLGYGDKTEAEQQVMRGREDFWLGKFNPP